MLYFEGVTFSQAIIFGIYIEFWRCTISTCFHKLLAQDTQHRWVHLVKAGALIGVRPSSLANCLGSLERYLGLIGGFIYVMSPNLGAQHIHPNVKKKSPSGFFFLWGKGHRKFGSMPPVPIFLIPKKSLWRASFWSNSSLGTGGCYRPLTFRSGTGAGGSRQVFWGATVRFNVDFRYDLDAP